MWADLLAEITSRHLAARTYFAAVVGPQGDASAIPPPAYELTAKGLMFVQMYAIYEYTIIQIVRIAITELKSRRLPLNTLRLELMGLLLSNELKSVIACGPEKTWKNRLHLFKRVASVDPTDVPDNEFPFDGSHYRKGQLETIWEIFGIAAPIVHDPPVLGLIDELVDHRNAIAHGRVTPEDVGRRYSKDDCYKKLESTRELCGHLVATMRAHCAHAPNLAR